MIEVHLYNLQLNSNSEKKKEIKEKQERIQPNDPFFSPGRPSRASGPPGHPLSTPLLAGPPRGP
jgi:hypothetical protein